MRIHLVHGIMDSVGKSGLLKLVPYFRKAGYDVRIPDYGLITACESKIVNPIIWRTMRPYIDDGDVYVGHSNGCAIGYDLVLDGWKPAGMVLIDAALEREIVLPASTWADVYFNEGDDATVAAVVAADLGLVQSIWGEMGHAGYQGSNALVANIDCARTADMPAVSGHSAIFDDGRVELWAPYIVERVRMRLAVARAL